jgi:hypothetical protein
MSIVNSSQAMVKKSACAQLTINYYIYHSLYFIHICQIMMIQFLISEQFNGTIWRMEIDELTETVLLEIRNSEDKKVCFGSAGLNNGVIHFKDISTSEQWLTGIEAAYDGVLLLHYYQTEVGPAHKGLLAIDVVTGEALWSNYNYAFDHLSLNGPAVYDTRVQPRKLFLANIKTGATTRIYEPSVYKELENNIVLPELITPDELSLKLTALHPFGNMVHYLEYNNFRIVSLHALKAGQLIQSLFIFDGVNKVYEDLLNTDIQKIQPEAFILHKNRLIYIKNKSELRVLPL